MGVSITYSWRYFSRPILKGVWFIGQPVITWKNSQHFCHWWASLERYQLEPQIEMCIIDFLIIKSTTSLLRYFSTGTSPQLLVIYYILFGCQFGDDEYLVYKTKEKCHYLFSTLLFWSIFHSWKVSALEIGYTEVGLLFYINSYSWLVSYIEINRKGAEINSTLVAATLNVDANV